MTDLTSVTFVVGTQRSGSTLLCRDIESLGGLGGPNEYFLDLVRSEDQSASEEDVIACIEQGVRDGATEIGAVKLMAGYAAHVDAYIRKAPRENPEKGLQNVFDWANARFENVTWIVLIREDILEQAISHTVSKMTDVWHRDAGDADPHADTRLPRWQLNLGILKHMHKAAAERRILERFVSANSDQCLVLTYKDLCDDPNGCAKKIAKHAAANGMQAHRLEPTRILGKLMDQDRVAEIKKNFKTFMKRQFQL